MKHIPSNHAIPTHPPSPLTPSSVLGAWRWLSWPGTPPPRPARPPTMIHRVHDFLCIRVLFGHHIDCRRLQVHSPRSGVSIGDVDCRNRRWVGRFGVGGVGNDIICLLIIFCHTRTPSVLGLYLARMHSRLQKGIITTINQRGRWWLGVWDRIFDPYPHNSMEL